MWIAYGGFVALAINPFGGLLVAIPYAKGVLGLSPWIAAAVGWPLAYLQVVFVDVLWESLRRIAWWERLVQRRRTPRLERVASSPYMFWTILAFGSFFGPWLVMAVMRYARVPHRRVALPLALSIGWNAVGIALLAMYVPHLLPK